MAYYPRILPAGNSALTVEFGNAIDPDINAQVIAFAEAVRSLHLDGMIEVVPTYRSATVYFDPQVASASALAQRLIALAEEPPARPLHKPRTVEIPVMYDAGFGPDLPDLARFADLSIEEVIGLHTSVTYRVYMLGFSPGFPYMGRVPEVIAMPRLADPRMHIPGGSVGIAGLQTGIYPQDSPGGWRIIGRTPLRLYDPNRSKPFLLQPGDHVRFVPIDRDEFDRLVASDSPNRPVHA